MTPVPPVSGTREALVRRAEWIAEGVLEITLADPHGTDLPSWEPGAHIDVVLPSGTVRQYSLCGDNADRTVHRIAVLRQGAGRGGSREIHDTALVGRRLRIGAPRNHFPLRLAPRYQFIAGGIGITPLLPMIRHLHAAGIDDWSLLYRGRTAATMAYRRELAELGAEKVVFSAEDRDRRPDLASLIRNLPQETAVYCCGPEGMLRAVESECRLRTPSQSPHLERFNSPSAPNPDIPGPAADGEDTPFEVELRRSGVTLPVPADRSLLDVVREAAPGVISSCEEGVCGSCEATVLDGAPLHRDSVLDEAERAEGDTMMLCVSRSRTPRLVLDL